MAKRKAPKKGKPRAAKTPRARKKPKPTNGREKQVELMDVKQPRDASLTAACEQIHDGLIDINEGTAAVQQGKAKALARMEKTGLHSYTSHNVRLTFNPGGAKVSAKLVDSDEGGEDDEPTDVNVGGSESRGAGGDDPGDEG